MGTKTLTAIALAACAFSAPAMADESADLVVNGEIEMVIRTAAPDHLSDVLDEIIKRLDDIENQLTKLTQKA